MEKKHLQRTLADQLIDSFGAILGSTSFSHDLPKKWEKHGNLVLLPESCFTMEIWQKIDENDLWSKVAKHFGVARIAKKGRICSDGHRTPQVDMLLGIDTWVCHIDNKIRYCYDITKCMFSAGNITEKIRMAQLVCSEEVIVDMFAGIGYFTLPLLVHAKAKHVHACEWNPHAVEALKRNIQENKVNKRCTVYEGDNRKVCPRGVADRIVMGLIPSAMGSIEPACRALRYGSAGVLHIHHNVDSNIARREHSPNCQQSLTNSLIEHQHESLPTMQTTEQDNIDDSLRISCNKRAILPEWLSWARETASIVKEVMNNIYREDRMSPIEFQTHILHIEKVKSYAPHIDHMVLDLKVEPCDSDQVLTIQPS